MALMHATTFWDMRARECRRRHARARAAAPVVAETLARLGARRVWLFGSALRPDRFREDSDLDLAVEGLPTGRLIDAGVAADRIAGHTCDLVEIETCDPALRARILREGELLLERLG